MLYIETKIRPVERHRTITMFPYSMEPFYVIVKIVICIAVQCYIYIQLSHTFRATFSFRCETCTHLQCLLYLLTL